MGRQLSRPFFPNSFVCLSVPCFIRLVVNPSVKRYGIGWSVSQWFCRSDSQKLGQVSVSVSWLLRRIVNRSMVRQSVDHSVIGHSIIDCANLIIGFIFPFL